MLLCDWAEDVGGKLYIQGAGWNRLAANAPASIAVAVLLEIPWDQANRPHDMRLQLVTEDGQPVMPDGETPLVLDGKAEVGRPPGTKPGSSLNAPFALKFAGIVLPPGGYRFELAINGEPLTSRSFTVE